jgi:hypothetical protein
MEKEFVNFEIACGLEFIGFSEPCLAFYDENHELNFNLGEYHKNVTDILSPLYQQAFTWFREKYELNYEIRQVKKYKYSAKVYTSDELHIYIIGNDLFDYESAEIAILEKMIKIVEKNATKKKNVKQTGVEFLRDIYKNNYGDSYFFDEADKLQIQIMNEFSQWIYRENYRMSHYNSFWYKEPNITQPNELSELYQLFLESKK